MQVHHITGDQLTSSDTLPEALPARGWLWVSYSRREFEAALPEIQSALQRWTGAPVFEPHVSDLLNNQLPSNFDYTSAYDLLVFRRLATTPRGTGLLTDERTGTRADLEAALEAIDTSPVGFVAYERVLLTVHPADCMVRDFFANRLRSQVGGAILNSANAEPRVDGRVGARMPTGPADLMVRMVNHMVDSYLDLRRLLSRQIEYLQNELFSPRGRFDSWQLLLHSRNSLHLLEDTCEDQRAAIVEWLDAIDEWPSEADPKLARDRELLRVRSRDVLEHIERVLTHVRRLESSVESAVQMHFSQQSNQTNNIMRVLTTLTAIFLPLNLVTGFFGMNFDWLPGIHSAIGFWVTLGLMATIGLGLSLYFWRKRYLRSA